MLGGNTGDMDNYLTGIVESETTSGKVCFYKKKICEDISAMFFFQSYFYVYW